MNWAIVMLGGPVVLATAYYLLGGRRTYTPPTETVDDFIDRYEAATQSSETELGSAVAEEKVPEQSVDAAEKQD
jgi:hypothetical protein